MKKIINLINHSVNQNISLFNPAIRLMNRFSYMKKFIILSSIVTLVFCVLIYQITSSAISNKQFSDSELHGVDLVAPTMNLLIGLQNYRLATLTQAPGNSDVDDAKSKIAALAEIVNKKNTQYDKLFKTSEKWSPIQEKLTSLLKKNNTLSLAKSTSLIGEVNNFIAYTCDTSKLTLDPDIDTFYLMDSYCSRLPALREEVSLIQMLALNAAKKNQLSAEDNATVIIQNAILNNADLTNIVKNINKVTDYNVSQLAVFEKELKQLEEQINEFNQLVHTQLLSNPISVNPSDWVQQPHVLLATVDNFLVDAQTSLAQLLAVRVHGILVSLLFTLVFALFGILLVIYLLIGLYLSIQENISILSNGSKKLSSGDLSADVTLTSLDELQEVANSFNLMKQSLKTLVDEIDKTVTSTTKGELTQLMTYDKQSDGFIYTLSKSINDMKKNFQEIVMDLLSIFNAMSEGDLKQHPSNKYQGTYHKLISNINNTCTILQSMVLNIQNSSKSIFKASDTIAISNTDVSEKINQQTGILEEITRRTSSLADNVQKNSNHARHANECAQTASSIATKGSEVMNDVIKKMSDINESAGKIFTIITAIDEITSQTNLLALNAAIEAAHAGEEGRGFAVVANEVRVLAQRSALAAKEINILVTKSVENINHGVELVDKAGNTMKEIFNSVDEVKLIMGDIANLSSDQNEGIERVNQSVDQMRSIMNKNLEAVRNTELSTEHLREQALKMEELVSAFKTDD